MQFVTLTSDDQDMFLELRHIFRVIIPGHRAAAIYGKTSANYHFALPNHTRILQGSHCEILHNIRNARFASQALV